MYSGATHRRRLFWTTVMLVMAFVATACSGDDSVTDTLQSPATSNAEPTSLAAENAPASGLEAGVEADGDADLIGELTALCAGGSDMGCDMLYHVSDHNSDAEALALNCGGRGPADGSFCTEGVAADPPNSWFSGDSPAVTNVVGQCLDGDMIACDFLFVRSAVGSRFEQVGLTCGGRVPVSNPNCRSTFPPDP